VHELRVRGRRRVRHRAGYADRSALLRHRPRPQPRLAGSIRVIDEVHGDYEEEIVSVDPFEARFTFRIGEDALALTVEGTTVTGVEQGEDADRSE